MVKNKDEVHQNAPNDTDLTEFKKLCELYGWTEDNISISGPMGRHVQHFINNPLMVILNRIYSLKKDGADEQTIRDIKKEVQKIARYCDFIDDLSKKDEIADLHKEEEAA